MQPQGKVEVLSSDLGFGVSPKQVILHGGQWVPCYSCTSWGKLKEGFLQRVFKA